MSKNKKEGKCFTLAGPNASLQAKLYLKNKPNEYLDVSSGYLLFCEVVGGLLLLLLLF